MGDSPSGLRDDKRDGEKHHRDSEQQERIGLGMKDHEHGENRCENRRKKTERVSGHRVPFDRLVGGGTHPTIDRKTGTHSAGGAAVVVDVVDVLVVVVVLEEDVVVVPCAVVVVPAPAGALVSTTTSTVARPAPPGATDVDVVVVIAVGSRGTFSSSCRKSRDIANAAARNANAVNATYNARLVDRAIVRSFCRRTTLRLSGESPFVAVGSTSFTARLLAPQLDLLPRPIGLGLPDPDTPTVRPPHAQQPADRGDQRGDRRDERRIENPLDRRGVEARRDDETRPPDHPSTRSEARAA